MSMDFYEKHTKAQQQLIHSIDPIDARKNQPGFIHMATVNGEEVAFLGAAIPDYDQFLYQFARMDQLVIPEFARLVNPNVIREQIPKNFKKGIEDTNPFDTSVEDFFYEGQIDQSVLVKIPSMITNYTETKRKFHHCHNFKQEKIFAEKHPIPMRYGAGGEDEGYDDTCPNSLLIPSFKDGILHYDPILFYIEKEDFEKSDRRERRRITGHDHPEPGDRKVGTIKLQLAVYFHWDSDSPFYNHQEPPFYSLDDAEMDKVWDLVDGVFLMPMVFPDQRIVYLCLLNMKGESNRQRPIKTNLHYWFAALDKVNDPTTDFVLYIGSDDLTFAAIDAWSIFVARDAEPVPVHRSQYLQEEVYKSTVQLCPIDTSGD